MTMDAVRVFEHSHARLAELALEIGTLLRGDALHVSKTARDTLAELSADLRDELLEHFANEEEALFPFIRKRIPTQSETIDRLAAAHDGICGAIVRFAHVVAAPQAAMGDARAAYERFETAYAAHSREEAEFFEKLAGTLNEGDRTELAARLRAL
jgi:iron-sulfur cluster repair protein YtfE (RIC family)